MDTEKAWLDTTKNLYDAEEKIREQNEEDATTARNAILNTVHALCAVLL